MQFPGVCLLGFAMLELSQCLCGFFSLYVNHNSQYIFSCSALVTFSEREREWHNLLLESYLLGHPTANICWVPSKFISYPTATVVVTDNLSSTHRNFSLRPSNVVDISSIEVS